LRVLARIEEARMWIERLQQALDGAIHEAVGRDFLDVLTLDSSERRRKNAVLLCDLVLGGQNAAAKDAAGKRRKHDRQNGRGERPGAAHSTIVADQVSLPQ
jgi:hypothetical protein